MRQQDWLAQSDSDAVAFLGDQRAGAARRVDAQDGGSGDGIRRTIRPDAQLGERQRSLRGVDLRRRDECGAVQLVEAGGYAGALLVDGRLVDHARRFGALQRRPRILQQGLRLGGIGVHQVG